MLRLYQLKVDDLAPEVAFQIAGGPNKGRAKLAATLMRQGYYEPVADMDLHGTSWGVETLYASTQNTDDVLSWSRNPPIGVMPIEPVAFFDQGQLWGRRSSMVGDVIEERDGETVMSRWVVDWQGFREVPL